MLLGDERFEEWDWDIHESSGLQGNIESKDDLFALRDLGDLDSKPSEKCSTSVYFTWHVFQ